MADSEQNAQESSEPSECLPCRGTGQVNSQLGGESNDVQCPWCAGTGVRRPGIDAQARWLQERAEHSDAAVGDGDPSGVDATQAGADGASTTAE